MAQNEAIINKLLTQIAREQNFVNYDVRIEPVSSEGANYTSALYNVTITEGNNVVYMFAKVAAIGEKMRTGAPKVYEIESFVYTEVMKAFKRLENEHQLPHEHRLRFSQFYGYNPEEYEETIVLENLVMKGYESYDRFKSIDWEYAKSAIKELAKLHALAFAYNEYHTEEFYKTIEVLKSKWISEDEQMKVYYDGVMQKAVEVTQEIHKDKLRRFFDGIKEGLFENIYSKWERRPVLAHGDYRPNNLLHRVQDVS